MIATLTLTAIVSVFAVVVIIKLHRRVVSLELRFSRVSQRLVEGQADLSEQLEDLEAVAAEDKVSCQKLVGQAQALIALANERVTNARSAYTDGALMRDNAIRRIEKWDAVTTDFVAVTNKWKDKMDQWKASARGDLDGVMSAQASSAGALTKRIKKLEEVIAKQ